MIIHGLLLLYCSIGVHGLFDVKSIAMQYNHIAGFLITDVVSCLNDSLKAVEVSNHQNENTSRIHFYSQSIRPNQPIQYIYIYIYG